jgi:hypothetical protein
MAVTAKVYLISKSVPADDGQVGLAFGADYADERNKLWAKATPSLNINMTVIGSVADHFAQGQRFTLTFDPEA